MPKEEKFILFITNIMSTTTQHIPITNIINLIAIADALGGGLEMESAESLVSTDLSKFHDRGDDPTFNTGYKPGMITDDTWMTLGLIDAVMKAGTNLSFESLLASYQAMYDKETQLITWSKKGKWWGGIEPVLQGQIDFTSWRSDKLTNSGKNPSNGSVMRAHILGYLKDENLIAKFAEQDATFSHPHPVSVDCSRILALLVHQLAYKQLPVQEVIQKSVQLAKDARVKAYFARLDSLPFIKAPVEATKLVCVEDNHDGTEAYALKKGTGVPCNALLTLGTALYIAKHVVGILPAMQFAIRMGGDVDSTAVVVTSLTAAAQATHKLDVSEDPVLASLQTKLLFKEALGEIASKFESFING